MGKSEKKKGAKDVLQIPCCFDDYKLKKTTSEMVLSFTIPQEKVDLAKPLLNEINEQFVIILYKLNDIKDADLAITFDEDELNA